MSRLKKSFSSRAGLRTPRWEETSHPAPVRQREPLQTTVSPLWVQEFSLSSCVSVSVLPQCGSLFIAEESVPAGVTAHYTPTSALNNTPHSVWITAVLQTWAKCQWRTSLPVFWEILCFSACLVGFSSDPHWFSVKAEGLWRGEAGCNLA